MTFKKINGGQMNRSEVLSIIRSEPDSHGELPASGAEQVSSKELPLSGLERSDRRKRKRPAHIG
jgi:hypothetical protein